MALFSLLAKQREKKLNPKKLLHLCTFVFVTLCPFPILSCLVLHGILLSPAL